jgi:hypothetical protein
MRFNPFHKASAVPSNWRELYTGDFRQLLELYSLQQLQQMIAYSQSESQQEYYRRPEILLRRHLEVAEDTRRIMKNSKMWEAICDSYLSHLQSNPTEPEPRSQPSMEEIEFLDETPNNRMIFEEDQLVTGEGD